jgi:hypothetical protein
MIIRVFRTLPKPGKTDELVMASVWESLEAMKYMTGDTWESAVIPDERLAEIIAETDVRHVESIG